MQRHLTLFASLTLVASLTACGEGDGGHAHGPDSHTHGDTPTTPEAEGGSHVHADGTVHNGPDHATTDPKPPTGGHVHADGTRHEGPDHAPSNPKPPAGGHTHADGTHHAPHGSDAPVDDHAGAKIGPAQIGGMKVELAQGHGAIAAGKESHLVVRLPYEDSGATIVRAWIGSQDRTLSMVGRGDYSASPSRYDIHATAPSPLPANPMWWIEIQKPDGTKVVGSATPITQ